MAMNQRNDFECPEGVSLVQMGRRWKAFAKNGLVRHVNYGGSRASAVYGLMKLLGREAELNRKPSTALSAPKEYDSLVSVLQRALEHASVGKGQERHAEVGEAFEEQKICQINRWLGGPHGALFQAVKKTLEAQRLTGKASVHELLGAINYLAAAVILIEEKGDVQ